jgi:hypothetical protein
LLVDSNRSRIIHVPSLKPEDVKEERKMIFSVSPNATTNCSLDFIFRGYRFDVYNSLLTQYSRNEQTEYIHRHIPFSDFELTDWKLIKSSRSARELELRSNISIQGILHSMGNGYYFSPASVEIPDFDSPKNRKLPIQLSYPKYVTDTLVYLLPSLLGHVSLPENRTIESKFGNYMLNFKQDGNNILVTRQFLLYAGYYTLNEYTDFYNFIAAIKTIEKNKILIQQP